MNAITAIAKPAAPASRQWASMLTRPEGWTPEPLPVNAKLIPLDAARRVVGEMTAALDGMTAAQASATARNLMGAYPARAVNDADTFAEFAALAFTRCPPDLGPDVVVQLVSSLKWLPTAAEITEAVRAATRDRHVARQVAEQHVREHERRREAGRDVGRRYRDLSPEERAEFDAMVARAKAGMAQDGGSETTAAGGPKPGAGKGATRGDG